MFFWFVQHFQKNIRSEEHTSELQSRGHLVCCLLLEKQKLYTKRKNLTCMSLVISSLYVSFHFVIFLYFVAIQPHPSSSLFPYTTLFRSKPGGISIYIWTKLYSKKENE